VAKAFYPVFYLLSLKIWQVRIQDSNYLNEDSHSDPRLIAYWERCLYLLDECPKPYQPKTTNNGRFVMHMSSKAQQVDMDFYNEIECLQAKGQCYEYLQAFASRASQLARRLATVFAYFEGLAEIDAVTLAGACDIVRYSLGEWARYAEVESVKEQDAEKLLKNIVAKCKKINSTRILKNIALKGAPSHLRKKKQFEECLNELIESNYLRLIRINQSMYIELNPLVLD
jgi:hypothetical protein